MMRGGAVEKEKTSHASGPGLSSRPGFFFPFFGRFFFFLLHFFFSTFFLPIDGF